MRSASRCSAAARSFAVSAFQAGNAAFAGSGFAFYDERSVGSQTSFVANIGLAQDWRTEVEGAGAAFWGGDAAGFVRGAF